MLHRCPEWLFWAARYTGKKVRLFMDNQNEKREVFVSTSIVMPTLSEMEAEIFRVRSVLNGAFTLVEARLLECDFGEYTRLIEGTAGDVNVLLSVAEKMLDRAEKMAVDCSDTIRKALEAEQCVSDGDKESESA